MASSKIASYLLETLLADPGLDQMSIRDSISVPPPNDASSETHAAPANPAPRSEPSGGAPGELRPRGGGSAGPAADSDPLPRRLLVDPGTAMDPAADYRLIGSIGRGGTGIVYQAHQRAVHREVAVKVLRGHLRDDPVARERFLGEARTMGALDHPNVIALHELAADAQGRVFYSMKRIDGTAWSEVIEQNSLEENLTILLRVSDAIRYAHSRGIVHRDIKPANVMLGRYGEVLVADWGLAVPHPAPSRGPGVAGIGGTPAYMAPELATGELDAIGPRTDVYLLGATLFELLTGMPPHQGASLIECIRNAAENRIASTEIQSELMDVAMAAMATDPEQRFGTVEQFQRTIREYQQHQESIALVRRASKHAEAAAEAPNYERFSLAMSLVREALELWPDNRRAKTMLRRLRMDFAQIAADQGDLDLALSMLEAAEEGGSELALMIRQRRERRTLSIEREARYSTLFASSPDAVLVTRMLDGTVVDANETFLRMFEHEREQIMGVRVADFHLWVCPERREDFVRQIRETGRADNFETVLRTRSDRHIPVLVSARRAELDGELLVVAHTRDITLRRAAEDELRRSKDRLREIQQLANLGTWEIQIETGQVRWSDETYRIAGLNPATPAPDLEGYLAMVHPSDRERTEGAIRRAIEHGEPFQLQVRHRRGDGTTNTTITRGQPIVGPDGRVVELYGTVLDISDRKQLEDQLNAQVRGLQAILDVVERPLVALMRSGEVVAASPQACAMLDRHPGCARDAWRFEPVEPGALAGVEEEVEMRGVFLEREEPVGGEVALRLTPRKDWLVGELQPLGT